MLDTSTCVKIMREPSPVLSGRFNRFSEQICISSITRAELHFGAENSTRVVQNTRAIDAFVARLTLLDFDSDAALHYGQIRVALRRQPIGPLDTLIAAHARSRSLTIVTDNVREFERVPGLQVENWVR